MWQCRPDSALNPMLEVPVVGSKFVLTSFLTFLKLMFFSPNLSNNISWSNFVRKKQAVQEKGGLKDGIY